VRYEGDTMIVSIMEEVLVVEKRWMLKEEIHLRQRRVERHQPQRVTLRREEALVEHINLQET
jgi:stress response protein YsnF